VFLDGVYLASTTGALLTVFDAASIEVLRGPQGTLFGRNTIGGLINVRRNTPTGEFGGKISATYGSFDQFDLKGVIDLPAIANGAIKAKVAAVRLDGGGYFYNTTRDKREGDNDLLMISPQVEFGISDKINLLVSYDYIRDKSPTRPVTSLTTANQLFGSLGGLGQPARNADFHRRPTTSLYQEAFLTTHSITGNLDWNIGDGHDIIALVNYRDTDESAIQEFDAVEAVLFSTLRPQQIDQFSAELRYQGDLGPVKLVSGLYYFESSYNNNQRTFFFGGEVGGTDYQQSAKSYAVFAQADWNIVGGLSLSLGARYLRDEKTACGGTATGPRDARNFDSAFSVSYGDCSDERQSSAGFIDNVDGSQSWNKFTPRIGLSYQMDDVLLYASYSEGFRSGGFNGRGSSPASFGPYDPETVANWEFGIKSEWLDNRLQVNLTTFFLTYSDKQEDVVFPDPIAGTVTIVQNAASATINGFEAEIRAMPVDGLTFGFNFGYLDASYDAWSDLGTILDGPNAGTLGPLDKSNFDLRRAPKFSGEVNVAYEHDLGNDRALLFNADYNFKSSYSIVANTVTINDPNPGIVPDIGLLNGSISFKTDRFKISAFGRNILNENYFMHVLDVGTTFGRTSASPAPVPTFGLWSFGTINPPATYGVEVQFKF
ncbi:MAG: TonB-dependent receptor, partial [Sandaracinobacteroides sp.]